jgi:hypothetical protein
LRLVIGEQRTSHADTIRHASQIFFVSRPNGLAKLARLRPISQMKYEEHAESI